MTTSRLCLPCGKLSRENWCLSCGKAFGRVCKDGHVLPVGGGLVCECGERALMPQTSFIDVTTPIRIVAWALGIMILSFIVRHGSQVFDAGSEIFHGLFGITPMGLFITVLDRLLFWTIGVVLLSLILPKQMGQAVRSWWYKAVCFGFVMLGKGLRLAAIGLWRFVEGKPAAPPQDKGGH